MQVFEKKRTQTLAECPKNNDKLQLACRHKVKNVNYTTELHHRTLEKENILLLKENASNFLKNKEIKG